MTYFVLIPWWAIQLSVALIAVVAAVASYVIPNIVCKYFSPAQCEHVGSRYGLKRAKWEPIRAWEARIWRATERRLDTADRLMDAAINAQSIHYFPPGQRPKMPDGVTWMTGHYFANGLPFVAWLPDEDPVAVAFRAAHAVPPHEAPPS